MLKSKLLSATETVLKEPKHLWFGADLDGFFLTGDEAAAARKALSFRQCRRSNNYFVRKGVKRR
jgi:hypothetical protein